MIYIGVGFGCYVAGVLWMLILKPEGPALSLMRCSATFFSEYSLAEVLASL